MNKKFAKGYAILERYKVIYHQNRYGNIFKLTNPNSTMIQVTPEEKKYAIEVIEILNGKYGEDCGVPTEEYMAELLQKADELKRKVGFVPNKTKVDVTTGISIPNNRLDGSGYIGIL